MISQDEETAGFDATIGSSKPVVNSVVAALAILRLLARSDDAVGVTVIAKSLNIKRSSAFNILKTLSTETFLSFNEVTKRYALGPGALELARLALDGNRTFNRIRSIVAEIGEEFGGTSQLWKLREEEDRLELVGFVESRAIMRIQMSVGQRIPALSGAVGRIYAGHLARAGSDKIEQRFDRVRWEAGMSFDKFLRDAKSSARRGWATDGSQFIKGVTTVAAVIRNLKGEPAYFLSNSSFAGQHGSAHLNRLGEALARQSLSAEKIIFGHALPARGA